MTKPHPILARMRAAQPKEPIVPRRLPVLPCPEFRRRRPKVCPRCGGAGTVGVSPCPICQVPPMTEAEAERAVLQDRMRAIAMGHSVRIVNPACAPSR